MTAISFDGKEGTYLFKINERLSSSSKHRMSNQAHSDGHRRVHEQRPHHQGRATGRVKCIIYVPKQYVECHVFSLYGASRETDRCRARFADCERSQLLKIRVQVERVISTEYVKFIFDNHISGTSRYTAGKPATWKVTTEN